MKNNSVAHRWHASITVLSPVGEFEAGQELRFGNVDTMPLTNDRTKQYEHPELEAIATYYADKELGGGNWRFTDKSNPYKFNADPASDYGWR